MTKGMILVPASLSPFFTKKPLLLVAIIISPKELTLFNKSLSTRNKPSIEAFNSIFPSLGKEASIFIEPHKSLNISAASSSCNKESFFSITKRFSLPTLNKIGISSSLIICPFLKTGPLNLPGIIWVMS